MIEKAKLITTQEWGEIPTEWAEETAKALLEAKEVIEKFSHPDLTEMLGGNSEELGGENIIYVRNRAILKIKHFSAAREWLNKHSGDE